MKLSNETKVGGLIFITLSLALGFAWLIGAQNPFKKSTHFYVTYNFAGGIEVGSPVRVSGIKVGKVEKIEFFSSLDPQSIAYKEPGSAPSEIGGSFAPLKLKLSVQSEAIAGIREDSRFYVNLAGIIGERYIEVTPGSLNAPQIQEGQTVPGVDPPRIDQLISQSFDLAGKIKDLVDQNSNDITKSIELVYKLSGNLNKTLEWIDKSGIFKRDLGLLVENLVGISSDIRKLTSKLNTPEGEKTLELVYQLLWRLEPVDKEAIQKFFQKEGMKVRFF